MAFLAGEKITAGRLQRLQPKTYYANATGTVAASQSNAIVPGCSITLTTETAGATVKIEWFLQVVGGGTVPAGNSAARAFIDAVTPAPVFAYADIRTVNEKVVSAASWTTTIATAGSHTIDLRATTIANMTIGTYSGIAVTVFEVV